ncbi:acid phosphatase [Williamsia deligens]|uniref:Acid phosphatase n=1 Tax=Williamsia deligens TaxID=321325 RepID=A0ABW3G161_9NOCA|nr:acid phosphatase [Williamsia deligens]MCP2194817.1 putative phosphoglycerate mutase [Williamsia deligens]
MGDVTRHAADSGGAQAAATHRLIVIRHGETEWSKTGRHTGSTDIDLTDTGVEQARSLTDPVAGLSLVSPVVISSPRVRARRTAELAGLTVDETDEAVTEWDYGDYEGRTSTDIHETRPGWNVFDDGGPGGESPEAMTRRVDGVIASIIPRLESGDVVVVTHGHFSRSLLARWVGAPIALGQHLTMLPASIAVLGYDGRSRNLTALGITGYRSADYVDAGRPSRRMS